MATDELKPQNEVVPQAESQSSAQITPPTSPAPHADPSAPPVAAGAQGVNETLKRSMYDALMNTTWDQTISDEQYAEFRKGNEVEACVWLHGPAQLQVLALADRRLTNAANTMNLEKTPLEYVEKVHGRLIPGTPYFVIRPARKGDLSATKVKRYESDSSAWVNFINVLGPTQFRVESGWKERFAVANIPKGSPLGDGIVIDLSAPLERRVARKSKDEESEGEKE